MHGSGSDPEKERAGVVCPVGEWKDRTGMSSYRHVPRGNPMPDGMERGGGDDILRFLSVMSRRPGQCSEEKMREPDEGGTGMDEKVRETGKEREVRRRTFAVLAAGAVICLTVTGFLLYDYHRSSLESERVMEELRSLEGRPVAVEEPPEPAMPDGGVRGTEEAGDRLPEEPPQKENPYMEVFQQYPDIKGWLHVEGTPMDYPVLQREGEDEYYLYRDYRGAEDKRGSLILDEDSSVEGGEFTTNLLIHGHNMKDGSMFGELDEYRSEDYCREHACMTLYTRDGVHEYEVMAVFESQVYYASDLVFKYYNFFQADTEEEFHYFYDNVKELSLYDTGVTAEYGDGFLTLSTCAYHVEDGRFVVVAKEISDEKEGNMPI